MVWIDQFCTRYKNKSEALSHFPYLYYSYYSVIVINVYWCVSELYHNLNPQARFISAFLFFPPISISCIYLALIFQTQSGGACITVSSMDELYFSSLWIKHLPDKIHVHVNVKNILQNATTWYANRRKAVEAQMLHLTYHLLREALKTWLWKGKKRITHPPPLFAYKTILLLTLV